MSCRGAFWSGLQGALLGYNSDRSENTTFGRTEQAPWPSDIEAFLVYSFIIGFSIYGDIDSVFLFNAL